MAPHINNRSPYPRHSALGGEAQCCYEGGRQSGESRRVGLPRMPLPTQSYSRSCCLLRTKGVWVGRKNRYRCQLGTKVGKTTPTSPRSRLGARRGCELHHTPVVGPHLAGHHFPL